MDSSRGDSYNPLCCNPIPHPKKAVLAIQTLHSDVHAVFISLSFKYYIQQVIGTLHWCTSHPPNSKIYWGRSDVLLTLELDAPPPSEMDAPPPSPPPPSVIDPHCHTRKVHQSVHMDTWTIPHGWTVYNTPRNSKNLLGSIGCSTYLGAGCSTAIGTGCATIVTATVLIDRPALPRKEGEPISTQGLFHRGGRCTTYTHPFRFPVFRSPLVDVVPLYHRIILTIVRHKDIHHHHTDHHWSHHSSMHLSVSHFLTPRPYLGRGRNRYRCRHTTTTQLSYMEHR